MTERAARTKKKIKVGSVETSKKETRETLRNYGNKKQKEQKKKADEKSVRADEKKETETFAYRGDVCHPGVFGWVTGVLGALTRGLPFGAASLPI